MFERGAVRFYGAVRAGSRRGGAQSDGIRRFGLDQGDGFWWDQQPPASPLGLARKETAMTAQQTRCGFCAGCRSRRQFGSTPELRPKDAGRSCRRRRRREGGQGLDCRGNDAEAGQPRWVGES